MLSKPEAFFAHVREHLFGGSLSQGQVTGINAILDAWDRYGDGNRQRLAYVLATPNVETGGRFQPVYEMGPRAYFDKYEPGTKLGKRLGNIEKGEGYLRRGRGLVQLTGRDNDIRVGKELGIDLLGHPELAMQMDIAARILVLGTLQGWFTGKGLSDYIDDLDENDDEDLREFVQARRTVNGQDKAALIAGHAAIVDKALELGGYGVPVVVPAPPDIEPISDPPPPTTDTKVGGISPGAIIIIALIALALAGAFFWKGF